MLSPRPCPLYVCVTLGKCASLDRVEVCLCVWVIVAVNEALAPLTHNLSQQFPSPSRRLVRKGLSMGPDAITPTLSLSQLQHTNKTHDTMTATRTTEGWPYHICNATDYRGNQSYPFACFLCARHGTCTSCFCVTEHAELTP
jgi:hypothetical protein